MSQAQSQKIFLPVGVASYLSNTLAKKLPDYPIGLNPALRQPALNSPFSCSTRVYSDSSFASGWLVECIRGS